MLIRHHSDQIICSRESARFIRVFITKRNYLPWCIASSLLPSSSSNYFYMFDKLASASCSLPYWTSPFGALLIVNSWRVDEIVIAIGPVVAQFIVLMLMKLPCRFRESLPKRINDKVLDRSKTLTVSNIAHSIRILAFKIPTAILYLFLLRTWPQPHL